MLYMGRFDFSPLKFVRGFVKNFEKVYVHEKVFFLCGMYPTQIHIPTYSTLQILLKRKMCGTTKIPQRVKYFLLICNS